MLDPQTLGVDFSGTGVPFSDAACEKASQLLEEHGAFVAKGIFTTADLKPIQEHIRNLVALIARDTGNTDLPAQPGELFDAGFMALNRINREYGGLVYNACRRVLPVHQLSSDYRLAELSKRLMKTQTLMCSNFKAVRIDQPSEDKYLFEWHQDYPYIQDSEDGLVYWIPLHDVDASNGNVVIAPGSHKLGLQPVAIVDPENKNKNGAASMTLANKAIVDKYPHIGVPIKEGEVLVFNELLLHRSSPNRTQRARWTLQVRHGNFEQATAIARKWPGGMIEGVSFAERHADYVTNLNEIST
jgi:ectoine hydroxylase-related dioxygenase (phytanoyl-CoA dioxygenase family)